MSRINCVSWVYLVLALMLSACGDSTKDGDQEPQVTVDAPSIPQNINVSLVSGQANIRWDLVSGASFYTVYWNNTGNAADNSTIVVTANSYIHEGLVSGSTYNYVVTASNTAGESSSSSSVSVAATIATLAVP